MGSIQNIRILRFLIILAVVVLTIFIYASYSSNQSLAPPHIRNAALMGSFAAASSNKSGEFESGSSKKLKLNTGSVSGSAMKAVEGSHIYGSHRERVKEIIHHREPTIDENADDNGGGENLGGDDVSDEAALERFNNNELMEEQYGQNVENLLGNNNNSSVGSIAEQPMYGVNASKAKGQGHEQPIESQQQQSQVLVVDNSLNKIPESDVLIPTSNLQKFIENADKILKNITVLPSAASVPVPNESVAASKSSEKDEQLKKVAETVNAVVQSPSNTDNEKDKSRGDEGEALPPSAIMTIKGAGTLLANQKPQVISPIQTTSKSNASSKMKVVQLATGKQNATTPKAPIDPTQGIATEQIYENGHMNEEIDVERLCPNKGSDLKLLILITSAQTHSEARLAIRQTWGHYGVRRDVSIAFILGRTTNETLSLALTQENFIYGDLIRGHFIDSYNNLTLKTISALEWVDEHCSQAKYILKTDDDMFINIPKLLTFLDSHTKDKRVIFGRLAKKWKPIRNKKSKYYVSTGQFGASIFPAFTTGPAYVMSSDIVHELYVQSLHQVYLKLEDVFTTGIVAQQLGIKRVHVNEFLNRRIAFNPCNIRKAISVHMIKANEQFDLWKKLLDQTTKCK